MNDTNVSNGKDVLKGIGEVISQYRNHWHPLVVEAGNTIERLADHIIDSENTSGLRVHALEQELRTKQAYIDYLKSRLDDFDIGFQAQ